VRHCVLTGYSCLPPLAGKSNFPQSLPEAHKYLERGLPVALFLSIVRSLAHLPDERQCPSRYFVVTLPKHAWHDSSNVLVRLGCLIGKVEPGLRGWGLGFIEVDQSGNSSLNQYTAVALRLGWRPGAGLKRCADPE